MISYLQGEIIFQDDKSIIVKTDNLGYQVFVTERFLEKLKQEKIENIELYTYLNVREESLELFGFINLEELNFFKMLLGVNGVGPRVALHILSLANLSEIKQAIVNNRAEFLTKVSGVGKKTAERVVMELRYKIDDIKIGKDVKLSTEDEEVIDALLGLGYRISDAREALRKIPKDLKNSQEKLRAALKFLGK
ncbi:MAG: Holliday junction branch migration protein RuvA [bacterium]